MNQKIKKFFSDTIESYDTVVILVVQENKELQDCASNCLPFQTNHKFRLLDLGCGHGAILGSVLERFPNAEVLGIDFSPKMLSKAEALF